MHQNRLKANICILCIFPGVNFFGIFFFNGWHIRSMQSWAWFNFLLNLSPLNAFIGFFVTNKLYVWWFWIDFWTKMRIFMAEAKHLSRRKISRFLQTDWFWLANKNAIILHDCFFFFIEFNITSVSKDIICLVTLVFDPKELALLVRNHLWTKSNCSISFQGLPFLVYKSLSLAQLFLV